MKTFLLRITNRQAWCYVAFLAMVLAVSIYAWFNPDIAGAALGKYLDYESSKVSELFNLLKP